MAGMTLATRAKIFHRRFPDKRITANALRLLYKRNGIKMKKVYPCKTQPKHNAIKYALEEETCRTSLQQAIHDMLPIVYLDEIVFTSRTFQ
jgi:hypothetical protein